MFKVGNQVIYNGKHCWVVAVFSNNVERCYLVAYKNNHLIRSFMAQENELVLKPCDICEDNKCDYAGELGEFACDICKQQRHSLQPYVKEPYCKYCFNARVYKPTLAEQLDPYDTELTDENDSSSCVVGKNIDGYTVMINSGHGEPVNLEFMQWSDKVGRWQTVGKYKPKYCPECGRRLDEYDNDRR